MPLICQQREVGGEQTGCERKGCDNQETLVCFAKETPSIRVAPVTGCAPHMAERKTGRGDICSRRLEMLEISFQGDLSVTSEAWLACTGLLPLSTESLRKSLSLV